jgi:tetratricopeptide (TPR) repeat protein
MAAEADAETGDDEEEPCFEEPAVEGSGFDLAAELSGVLEDASSSGGFGASGEDDGFSSIFREFKKGVSDTLGDADHEAHYDLGIAYREMGLLDDAVGEFQAALASPARRVDSLHMLGLCTLALGCAKEAVQHLDAALDTPDIGEEQALATRFELGSAYESLGEIEKARGAWQAVAAMDPGFCEVELRLAALGEATRESPEPAEEGYESFVDLFEEADNEDTGSAEPRAAAHESFSDLIADANADAEEAGVPAAPEEPPPAEAAPEAEARPRWRRKKKISFV